MREWHIDPILTALLVTLLPGDGDWPAATETQAPAWVVKRATELPDFAAALNAVRGSLPSDFVSQDRMAQAAALGEVEARMPNWFAQVVDEAYRGYYTDPRVLARIEHKTGYSAAPPQPLGRKVRPSDWSVLAARRISPAPSSTLPSSGEIT